MTPATTTAPELRLRLCSALASCIVCPLLEARACTVYEMFRATFARLRRRER